MHPPARTTPYTRADLHQNVRSLHQSRLRLLNPGWICVIAAFALTGIGILAIGTTAPDYALRQTMNLCVGLVFAAFIVIPHYRWLDRFNVPLMIFVLGLLVFVMLPFIPESIVRPRHQARRWINFVVMDFQPSEIAKIAYVISLASYLKFRESFRRISGLLVPLACTFIPMGLIVIEPDLGTCLLFLPTLFAMLIAAGAKIRHLLIVVVAGALIAPAMYPVLKPHQKDRIKAMIAQVTGDDRYEDDIGYQGAKARTLVGAGGLMGVGQAHAADLISFNELPEEHNDMIFAVVCCRWGLLGGIGLWAVYGLFAIGALAVAAQARDPFGRLVPVGLVTLVGSQMIINTGMTIGLLPITGMTLPFVSYGGSSLLASWMLVGLILNIAMRRPQFMARETFDFEDGNATP